MSIVSKLDKIEQASILANRLLSKKLYNSNEQLFKIKGCS